MTREHKYLFIRIHLTFIESRMRKDAVTAQGNFQRPGGRLACHADQLEWIISVVSQSANEALGAR